MDLYQRSIDIILKNQNPSGGFIASPNFPTYSYSWFRDGSYIAYALNRVGQHQSARSFHLWCAGVIKRQNAIIESLVEKKASGAEIRPQEYLPARYTLAGERTGDDWTDFQLDGYGTWIWSLSEHIRLANDPDLLNEILPSLNSLILYLTTFWRLPCYDCWEENLDAVHIYTLAAIQAGLRAVLELDIQTDRTLIKRTIQDIEIYLDNNGLHPDGYVRKLIFPGGKNPVSELTNLVDASLIGLAVPFQTPFNDPEIIQNTLQKIEDDLYRPGGGVYRYLMDTYYGGGQWILLGSWLAWYWCRNGQISKAREMKTFIESRADSDGYLPEQVSEHLLAPSYYDHWVSRWGELANPLLWSHAMYLILCEELGSTSADN